MSVILVPGRWQVRELHKGHRELIQSAIDTGEDVVVIIRGHRTDADNPYSVEYRAGMIRRIFPEVKILSLDFDEIWHGRDIGYKIKEVRFSEEIEAISGTKIRAAERASDLME